MSQVKQLFLVRHAKSSWKDFSLSDIERPLNKRGFRTAPDMGNRLKARGVTIDRLISSPANRAITTAGILAGATGYQEQLIQEDDGIYFKGVAYLLQLIKETDESVASLMLVGHNPDMTSLLNILGGNQTDNMPTCAIAQLEIDMPWSEVGNDCASLIHYDFPKKQWEQ